VSWLISTNLAMLSLDLSLGCEEFAQPIFGLPRPYNFPYSVFLCSASSLISGSIAFLIATI